MTMRSLAVVVSAVVAVGVIAGAYLLGAHGIDHRAGAAAAGGIPRRSAAPPARPGESAAGGDPVAVATAWLRAYREMAWTDQSPSSWVDRVRPYVSSDLAADYDQARQGTAGTSWASFVHDQCTAIARDVEGLIPPEAPRAPDSVYVQVAGTVVTQCAHAVAPMPPEPVAATVEVRRMPDGRWVVNRRVF